MRIRSVVAAVATLTLGIGVMSSSAGAEPDDPATPTAEQSPETAARLALSDAESLFDGKASTAPRGSRDTTLVLRDLVARRSKLDASDRATADRLLARPAAQRKKCKKFTCVHWIVGGAQGVDPTDVSPDNGIPDYVDTVMSTMEHVHRTYVRAGYRAPETDNGKGGNKKRDIYLRQIGDNGLYGYCTTDQKPRNPPDHVWAYCVLDNDYDPSEFPTNTPIENMQVTAAHEYFHAVQFAYDFLEDGWFMEATATWAEDELYDGVNDNVNYLPSSQMGSRSSSGNPSAGPRVALDGFFNGNYYGNWIFFRYLTERLDSSHGGMPVLVRDMWRKADAKGKGKDGYSLQVIKSVLAKKHRNLGKTYAGFAEANRRTHTTYDEGVENNYPNAPLWKSFTLTAGDRSTGAQKVKLDHLTSATAAVTPGGDLTDAGWKLKVKADLAPKKNGSRVLITVYPTAGAVHVVDLKLNKKGKGSRSVAFRSGDVDHVEVTLVNASDRFKCGVAPKGFGLYSCSGRPKDDNAKEKLTAVAFR